MDYEIGDLVWAKMKGYPPWPAKIAELDASVKTAKSKKGHQFVYFFGSKNFAWIPNDNVIRHNESILEDMIKKKGKKLSKDYTSGIDELVRLWKKQGTSVHSESIEKQDQPSSSYLGTSEIQKQSLSKMKKKIENGKKSTKVVRILPTAPKTHERKVLGHKSPEKKNLKRKLSDNSINERNNINSSASNRHSVDKDELSPEKMPKKRCVHIVKSVSDSSSLKSGSKSIESSAYDNFSHCSRHTSEKDEPSDDNLSSSSKHSVEHLTLNDLLISEDFVPVLVDSSEPESSDSDDFEGFHFDKTFGFLGLGGTLGRSILRKFIKCGMKVIMWDENVGKCEKFIKLNENAKLADCPADLIENCDITFCCFDTDVEFRNILFGKRGILEGFEVAEKLKQTQKGFVALTFIDYETSKEINDAISLKNGLYIEAIARGLIDDAADCDLTIIASGNRQLFNECENCFQCIAKRSVFLGCEIGLSLKVNMISENCFGIFHKIMAECLRLSDVLEVNRKDMHRAAKVLFDIRHIPDKGKRLSSYSYEALLPLKHAQSVLDYILILSNEGTIKMNMTSTANEAFKYARHLKYSELDVTAVYKSTKY